MHGRQLLQEETRVRTDLEKCILPVVLHSNTPRMDTGNGTVTNMLQDSLLTSWQLCDVMLINSKGVFTIEEFCKQFIMSIKVDHKKVFRPDSTQDEFFSHIAQISQCDQCGAGTPPESPKMMTCSACRSVHYCDKECQRKHWKRCHKALCMGKTVHKEVFRVAHFCSKMLSVLSVGLDAKKEKVLGADSSYLHTAILRSGCKDHIYMPVFEEGTLMYIPMPLKFVAYLFVGGCRKDLEGTGLNSFKESDQRITIAVQTKVPVDKTTQEGVMGIVTETHVRLP